jgi:hypothetical protein
MQVLFESRPEVRRVVGQLYAFQCRPQLHADPVLIADAPTDDGVGPSYANVIHDGGVYRMWYIGWPKAQMNDIDVAGVGYAESDDGIHWHKPNLKLVEFQGNRNNNYCDLGMVPPNVFIDPDAPASHRYRSVGCIDERFPNRNPAAIAPREGAYFTAHSADGLHWELDDPHYRWPWSDNVQAIYHPGRRCAIATMKQQVNRGGLIRRAWACATFRDGQWGEPVQTFVPDEADDAAAVHHGYISADYYAIGMLPAGDGIVGFVNQFRHLHPYRQDGPGNGLCGIWGHVGISLAYQTQEGAAWVHQHGRPDFLAPHQMKGSAGGFYASPNVLTVGDEQRIYVTATDTIHCGPQPQGGFSIALAHWPKWRIFGFRADPMGEMDINLGTITRPCELVLNYAAGQNLKPGALHIANASQLPDYRAASTGRIRVALYEHEPWYNLTPIAGRGVDDAVGMSGNSLGDTVRWTNGSIIHPVPGKRVFARLFIEQASVFAYELRPL